MFREFAFKLAQRKAALEANPQSPPSPEAAMGPRDSPSNSTHTSPHASPRSVPFAHFSEGARVHACPCCPHTRPLGLTVIMTVMWKEKHDCAAGERME